ncbi:MAG: PAS domain S-box protein [Chloroflexota bacterium]|nr:PAS domain S-box protein [Chloroflexota bacterium]
MNDKRKTKAQLIEELEDLRKQMAELIITVSKVTEGDEMQSSIHWDRLRASVGDGDGQKCRQEGIYNTVVDLKHLPDTVMYMVDCEGNLIAWSRSMEAVTGLSSRQLMKKPLDQLFAEEDRTGVRMAFEEGIETCQETEAEARLIRNDGSPIAYRWNTSMLQDGEDNVIGQTGLGRDIAGCKAMEEVHREAESRYHAIFNNPLQMVYVCDDTGCFIDANDYALQRFGYTRDAIGDVYIQDIIHPDDISMSVKSLIQTIGRGRPQRPVELRLRSRSGEEIWVENFSVPLRRYKSRYQFLGIARDITDRKCAEERISQSEAMYRLLAENTSDLIWTIDTDLRYTYVSPSANRLLGYDSSEMMTYSLDQVLLPSSLEIMRSMLSSQLNSADSSQDDIPSPITLELECYCKGGSTIWTETTLNLLYNDESNLSGIVGVTRDITERKREQSIHEEAVRRYEAIFTNPLQIIYVHDEWGCLVEANDAAIARLGYTHDDLGTVYFHDIVHPDDLERAMGAIYSMDDTMEVRLVTKSGEIIWIDTFGILVADKQERIRGLGIAQDITDRKRAEEELRKRTEALERSNEELEQFAYVASHDLQEPLRMIGSYVQLLAKRYQGKLDADADDFIGYAVDGANRMQRMITDLLAYSRVGTRGEPFQSADCETVLYQTLTNLQIAIEESGAVVTHDPLPIVMADSIQLGQLFQNLISNAIKFRSGETPYIHVSAVSDNDEWVFSVRDNGIGIELDYAKRIFVIFQRLHGKSEYGGTGIGLAICKRIVERHGGQIWVESDVGKGSVFYFSIPVKGAES